MSRYIDADAIKIPNTHVDVFENCRNCKLLDEYQVREIINSAPSIDIVHCGECKHRGICFGRLVQGVEVVQLHFCSYGEREGE